MAVTHGMNPEEVERLGKFLQAKSKEITDAVAAIQKQINGTSWLGDDAKRFKEEWWPGHQGKLKVAAKDLHGFGQSALNNASEQRKISNR